MNDASFRLSLGNSPVLISLPHVGTELTADLQARLVPQALHVPDTDWHLEAIYAFAKELGVSMLVPRYSRYLIDLNRPPENVPMYPGANNTELCPTRAFTGEPLYREGQAPNAAEIERRIRQRQPSRSLPLCRGCPQFQTRSTGDGRRSRIGQGHGPERHLGWRYRCEHGT